MYKLPVYKENDPAVVRQFIDDNPFAFLSGCDASNKPVATQVPVFIEEEGDKKILRGHLMKNTDHHKAFLHNPNVLTVFTGRHCYVSATWYTFAHMASTWNYMSVQATGIIRFLDDAALEDVLRKTSLHFENNNHESTTVFDNLDETFKQKVMPAIVAFEIEVTGMNNIFKLSQDRDKASFENIIRELNKQGESSKVIAAEMAKRHHLLFPEKNNR
ncbi:MAG TPA: FMN-binding negative transcriptional regulator [Bacteroidia bacterium]|nr:FMN-binding negative transcriptional regulator [Bacteroidia bacterium]